ncbi:hypothetical protein FRC09_012041 [Ceratobasidium sp. 395]|nr:hypothetical protein FRC09_012041 [Ceratobasidium sp. 395]
MHSNFKRRSDEKLKVEEYMKKFEQLNKYNIEEDWSRLTNEYPTLSPTFTGAERPASTKRGPIWVKTAFAVADKLDSLQVQWSTIDPLAYANVGEAKLLICEFVIVIGVQPRSLAFKDAVDAAKAVVKILEDVGFPDIDVALVESIYRNSVTGSELMTFNPSIDLPDLPTLRKPFTPTLGLSISPFQMRHIAGSGGLFFRLSRQESDESVVLLTCAHVSRPPGLPFATNDVYTHQTDSGPREDVLLLGERAFERAVDTIHDFISIQEETISAGEHKIRSLENGAPINTQRYSQYVTAVNGARDELAAAQELLTNVLTNFQSPESRVFGFVLHCAKIEVKNYHMHDWSFIQLDEGKIDWTEFQGNRLFVGGNKTVVDWQKYMNHDGSCPPPVDMLLPLEGHIDEAGFNNPQDVDIHDETCLLAVKNGSATGTTFGRVNGLESVIRQYPEQYGIKEPSVGFIVCGYEKKTGKDTQFSDDGDSGSFVVGRDGRLIGLLTGGSGPLERADKSYITPYWALHAAMDEAFPGCHPIPATT